MKKTLFFLSALLVLASCRQNESTDVLFPEWEYAQIRHSLTKGWNTWDTRNVLNQVWSEDLLGIRLSFVDSAGKEYDQFRTGSKENDAAELHPYDHTYDGTYSEIDATWHGISMKLRSSAQGRNLVMLLTPTGKDNKGQIRIRPGKVWEAFTIEGQWNVSEDCFELISMFGTETMRGTVQGKDLEYVMTNEQLSTSLVTAQKVNKDGYYLCSSDAPVLICIGDELTVDEAVALLDSRRDAFESEQKAKWGDRYEMYHAMQSILAWDTVYDPSNSVVVTPVSRNWNMYWVYTSQTTGGYVLFDWDTYFASEMLSLDNRELAICNAVEITKAVDKCGFVPNFIASDDRVSYDRSQPPVGSRTVWKIYERYHDRWLLEMLYPRLKKWNQWWVENREADGLLCWGSSPLNGGTFIDEPHAIQQAVYESGLDNTWVYDEVSYVFDSHLLSYNDVGLNALYAMDCDFLSMIADELGHHRDAREIRTRGSYFKKNIQRLWSEEDGMFYCRDYRTGELVKRMDPTNFYPMISGAATEEQAGRMIREHLLNEEEFWGEYVIPCTPRNVPEFKDNDYWRGRIWGPTNYLVYLGLCNYDCADVRRQLAQKSNALLMKDWLKSGYIYENWNATTGEGDDVNNSDRFYHWGALLSYMSLLE